MKWRIGGLLVGCLLGSALLFGGVQLTSEKEQDFNDCDAKLAMFKEAVAQVPDGTNPKELFGSLFQEDGVEKFCAQLGYSVDACAAVFQQLLDGGLLEVPFCASLALLSEGGDLCDAYPLFAQAIADDNLVSAKDILRAFLGDELEMDGVDDCLELGYEESQCQWLLAFDADGDGVLTAAELMASDFVKMLLQLFEKMDLAKSATARAQSFCLILHSFGF